MERVSTYKKYICQQIFCHKFNFPQKLFTYFVKGSITVWLTSCLTGLDLTKPVNMFPIHH